jgi:hypothetical protein
MTTVMGIRQPNGLPQWQQAATGRRRVRANAPDTSQVGEHLAEVVQKRGAADDIDFGANLGGPHRHDAGRLDGMLHLDGMLQLVRQAISVDWQTMTARGGQTDGSDGLLTRHP